MKLPPELQQKLNDRKEKGLYRSLPDTGELVGSSWCSNDYLGFSKDAGLSLRWRRALEDLAETGSTGSRLLSGNHFVHQAVEKRLAEFSLQESALLFPSGFQANLALISGLVDPASIVFSDELNHASLIDGIRASGARRQVYRHRCVEDLEARLKAEAKSTAFKLIVTESFFSMDGDLAPLDSICGLAERYGAHVIVDEAHSTGIYGAGRAATLGLQERVLATVHTGGKALGCAGAWIASSAVVRDCLINFSRPFIFSTAPTPALSMLLDASVRHWQETGKGKAAALLELSAFARETLRHETAGSGLRLPDGEGPILPLIVGDSREATRISSRLREAGYRIPAIRPPTVAEGSARLRITVNLGRSRAEITDLARQLRAAVRGGIH